MEVDAENTLTTTVLDVEASRESRRWKAAPDFSRKCYLKSPTHKKLGNLRVYIMLFRDSLRLRDKLAERLRDIKELIIAGHNEVADQHIDRLRSDYPTEETKARVLGLVSLNLYDRGKEAKAQYIHEFALLLGTEHPAMLEIFGATLRKDR